MNRFWNLFTFLATSLLALPAFAQGGAAPEANGAVAIGAGLAIGIAVVGGTLGQGKASAAALEGIARNPNASDKIFTPMILGLALMESLVLLAFVVAFLLLGKV